MGAKSEIDILRGNNFSSITVTASGPSSSILYKDESGDVQFHLSVTLPAVSPISRVLAWKLREVM